MIIGQKSLKFLSSFEFFSNQSWKKLSYHLPRSFHPNDNFNPETCIPNEREGMRRIFIYVSYKCFNPSFSLHFNPTERKLIVYPFLLNLQIVGKFLVDLENSFRTIFLFAFFSLSSIAHILFTSFVEI
jgi:hypothetical protein